MSTRIYGSSDDLIEFDGDIEDEVYTLADEEGDADLIVCSDGTILEVLYGKAGLAVWKLSVVARGSLFDRLEICTDEDAEIYSDIAHFNEGLKWAYVASEWNRVG